MNKIPIELVIKIFSFALNIDNYLDLLIINQKIYNILKYYYINLLYKSYCKPLKNYIKNIKRMICFGSLVAFWEVKSNGFIFEYYIWKNGVILCGVYTLKKDKLKINDILIKMGEKYINYCKKIQYKYINSMKQKQLDF
jgi:hypothetical protein